AKLAAVYADIYSISNHPLRAKYPNGLSEAADALTKSRQNDTEKKFEGENKTTALKLSLALFQEGFSAFNTKNYDLCVKYLEAAATSGSEQVVKNYQLYQVRSYAKLNLKDTTAGIADMQKAIELYKTNPPKDKLDPKKTIVDSSMAYTFASLAQLQADYDKNVNQAIATLAEGRKMFPDNTALQQTETFMLLRPEIYEQGLAKLSVEAEKNPTNIQVQLAYAQLLEKKDTDKAIEVYRRVLALDPKNFYANFNLGAIYNNRAAELNKKANATNDQKEWERLDKETKIMLEKAYPFMKTAADINPKELAALQQAKQIAILLNKDADLPELNAKIKALTGK
ncbi:MAG: tetratricopeptide repeat protein, partial [Bacteroidia bacterium]|nr:tetratricopeptide repeat protein [Bacteroidia bacterium]